VIHQDSSNARFLSSKLSSALLGLDQSYSEPSEYPELNMSVLFLTAVLNLGSRTFGLTAIALESDRIRISHFTSVSKLKVSRFSRFAYLILAAQRKPRMESSSTRQGGNLKSSSVGDRWGFVLRSSVMRSRINRLMSLV